MSETPSDLLSTSGLHMLVGDWQGPGVGDFPTIDRVEYTEVLKIEWDADRGVLCYEQQAVLSDGTPSHRESGFIRPLGDGAVELWNAQDNGRTELLQGSSDFDADRLELRIDLESAGFGNDPRMLSSRRVFTVDSDRLSYEMGMTTTTTPEPDFLPHLSCTLERV